jgi:N-acetyl-anhydromuramyl-L-alanine amidase AmpD
MLTTLALVLQLQAPLVVKNFLPGKTPRDTTRNYIVIHNDGAGLNASATRRILQRRRLAYHYFISKDGAIYQWKDLKYQALHAGVSLYEGIKDWNKFSIGICLQGNNLFPYTDEQYQALTLLVNYINMRYPDSKEKPILGHSDVAYPTKRKKDPGEHFQLWRIYNDTTNHPRGQAQAP